MCKFLIGKVEPWTPSNLIPGCPLHHSIWLYYTSLDILSVLLTVLQPQSPCIFISYVIQPLSD